MAGERRRCVGLPHPFGAPVQDDDDKGALFSRSALDRLPSPQSANQKTRWRVPAGLKLMGIRGGGWSESRHPDSTTMPRYRPAWGRLDHPSGYQFLPTPPPDRPLLAVCE